MSDCQLIGFAVGLWLRSLPCPCYAALHPGAFGSAIVSGSGDIGLGGLGKTRPASRRDYATRAPSRAVILQSFPSHAVSQFGRLAQCRGTVEGLRMKTPRPRLDLGVIRRQSNEAADEESGDRKSTAA